MKTKIFQALKQEYPQLGLGDEVLQARAEALAATGLVTDDNLKAVVASQKANLEALQKSNDKRVTDAIAKAKKEAEEAAAKASTEHAAAIKAEQDKLAALQKEYEEFKAKQVQQPGGGGQATEEVEKRLNEAFDAKLAAINKTIEELNKANKGYADKLKTLEDEKAAAAKAAAAAARQEMILAKAKEVGIPEWRIKQGFSFADDMDEAKITETLTGYATDIKAQMLPGRSQFQAGGDTALSNEEVKGLVKDIMRR